MCKPMSARDVKGSKGAAKAPVVNAPERKGSARAKAVDADLKDGSANSNASVANGDSQNGTVDAVVADAVTSRGRAKSPVSDANKRKGSAKVRAPGVSAERHKRTEEVPLGNGDTNEGSGKSQVAKAAPRKRTTNDKAPVGKAGSEKRTAETPVVNGDTGVGSPAAQIINGDPRKAFASAKAPAAAGGPKDGSARLPVANNKAAAEPARPHVRNGNLSGFLAQIARRVDQGEVARKVLVAHLAKLSIEEMRSISPTIIGRLGPAGLAELVQASAGLRARPAGLAMPAMDRTTAVAGEREPIAPWRDWLRREPLPWQMTKSLFVSVVVAILFLTLVPLLGRAVFRPPVVDGAANCEQLDFFTGDCVYQPGTDRLTMERAAEALHLPLDALAAANPNLSASVAIPRGASLRVPARTFLKLR